MTTPVAHGFPDWARWAATSDAVFLNISTAAIVAPDVHDLGFVGNQPGLYCWLDPTINNCKAEFAFYADAAETILIDTYRIDCRVVNVGRQPVPILGPFCKVTVTPGPSTTCTYSIRVFAQPQYGAFSPTILQTSILSQNLQGILSGATVTYDIAEVREGEVSWTAQMTGASFNFTLQALDKDNNATILERWDATSAAWPVRRVFVPPMSLQVLVNNTNASSETFSVFATHKLNRT